MVSCSGVVSYWVAEKSGVVYISDSTGKSIDSSDPDELLSFLRYRQSGVLRVFWDLDGSISPVLRKLGKSVLKSLSQFDENTTFGEHQLYYLHDRLFRVGKSRFYGIQSFWPTDFPAPETLSELQSRAEELLDTLDVCGLSNPSKLTSPIAVFESSEQGKAVYQSVPKGYDLPSSTWGALEYAFRCDRREWISAHRLGSWKEGEIWDYDLSGAYPSCASNLLDIRDMEVWQSSICSARERSATYGFLTGHLWLDPNSEHAHCSPIVADLSQLPGNPVGDLGVYDLTLDELRLIEKYSLGTFELYSGWFLRTFNGVTARKPFAGVLSELYSRRSYSPLASSVMKGIANQLVGKLIETKVTGDYGELRNDIYHATILAQARVKVAEFLIQNEVKKDELVVVQTDGVKLTRNIPCSGSGMGKWRNNGSQDTIVASPYKVYCGDKKPGHLTREMVTNMIAEHPASQFYGASVKHTITLRQAIQQGDISLVGAVVDFPASLDLSHIETEQNRSYPKLPRNGRQLMNEKYTSAAVEL